MKFVVKRHPAQSVGSLGGVVDVRREWTGRGGGPTIKWAAGPYKKGGGTPRKSIPHVLYEPPVALGLRDRAP